MQGYSFDTFTAAPGNRNACEAARALAGGHYTGPRPLVLLGPEGAGKSHLLWSVVKEVRASARRTGLALIMAREFPEKVRALVQNPAPIQQGRPALLLVDDLEHFRDSIADLEGVVRAFLDNGHPVAVATCVDPERLPHLSAGLKSMLAQGALIEIARGGVQAQAEGGAAPANTLSELEAVRRERDDLERALREKSKLEDELAALKTRLELSQAEEERLNRLLTETGVAKAGARDAEDTRLRARVAALENAITTAERERDALRNQLAAGAGVQRETERLRAQLAAVQADAESAFAEQARLQGLLGAARRALEENSESRATASPPRDDADALARMRAGAAHAHALLDQARTEAEHSESLLAQARSEQGRLQVALDGARGRMAAIEFELEKARKQLSLQMAEMDALREEAATQSATAHLRAAEMERRLADLEEVIREAAALAEGGGGEAAHVAGNAVLIGGEAAQFAARIGDDCARLAQAAKKLEARLIALHKAKPQAPAPMQKNSALERARQLLEEPDLFESVPDGQREQAP